MDSNAYYIVVYILFYGAKFNINSLRDFICHYRCKFITKHTYGGTAVYPAFSNQGNKKLGRDVYILPSLYRWGTDGWENCAAMSGLPRSLVMMKRDKPITSPLFCSIIISPKLVWKNKIYKSTESNFSGFCLFKPCSAEICII